MSIYDYNVYNLGYTPKTREFNQDDLMLLGKIPTPTVGIKVDNVSTKIFPDKSMEGKIQNPLDKKLSSPTLPTNLPYKSDLPKSDKSTNTTEDKTNNGFDTKLDSTGVTSIIGAGLSLWNTNKNIQETKAGIEGLKNMAPYLSPYKAPLEPTLIKDNTAAQKAAAEESINTSVNTQRDIDRRLGITNRNPVYLSKELEAKNQLSAQIETERNNINAQNAQIDNSFKLSNRQEEVTRDANNAQTLNNFNLWKSGQIGAAQSAISAMRTSGLTSTLNNLNQAFTQREGAELSEKKSLENRYSELEYYKYNLDPSQTNKLADIIKEMDEIKNKLNNYK